MSTFLMFGKYSSEALRGISAERTKKATELIKKAGGKITAMYVLLGNYDLVLIVDLPNDKEAIKISIELNKLTGIAFTSSPAITVDEFDKIVAGK